MIYLRRDGSIGEDGGMALQSEYLKGDARLEAAAVSHPAHIVPGSSGDHVGKIQRVLITLDGASIDDEELREAKYGKTTADAVFNYKDNPRRKIINKSYQQTADKIVGIMTMASFDREMAIRQIGDPDFRSHRLPERPDRNDKAGFDAVEAIA